MNFEDIDFNVYKKAIDIFIKTAYPGGVKEDSFCHNNIKCLDKAKNEEEILKLFEKEKASINGSKEKRRYVLRLGSEKYPFVKLVLQETNIPNG